MPTDSFHDVLILTGPTGSGKSQLALDLAQELEAEIVSMDSMALYRGMDIGTAKPTAAERRRIPHHLIDVLDPWESASVAWWLEQAARSCQEIRARGRRIMIVGGTPLYLKALLRGLFSGPAEDRGLRDHLAQEAEEAGSQALHDRLAVVDPVTAARVHPHDVRRVIRALEIWQLTGQPISACQREWSATSAPGQTPPCLWLDLPRETLYARINARVERMFAEGLVEEVRALRDLPRALSREARQALGYKEVFVHLDGGASLDETIALIQTRSRNFAKRQITWFRHLPECRRVNRELTGATLGLTMKKA
jgi:tRNA dimethylallyltransferase